VLFGSGLALLLGLAAALAFFQNRWPLRTDCLRTD